MSSSILAMSCHCLLVCSSSKSPNVGKHARFPSSKSYLVLKHSQAPELLNKASKGWNIMCIPIYHIFPRTSRFHIFPESMISVPVVQSTKSNSPCPVEASMFCNLSRVTHRNPANARECSIGHSSTLRCNGTAIDC